MTQRHLRPGDFARHDAQVERAALVRPYERRRRAALPVAIASLVGLVVVTGSGVTPSLAGDPGPEPLTIVLQPPAAETPAPAPAPSDPGLDAGEPLDDAPVDLAPAPAPTVEPAPEPAPVETVPEEKLGGAEDETDQTAQEEEPAGSPIRHVFLVVLGDADVAALAQDEAAAPYLAETLVPDGTLLTEYRTVAGGALANGVALVSGQGPTAQTLADCTTYGDVRPAEPLADGQVEGDGCVYGYETGTLADQLRGLGREWRTYVQPAAATAHPAPGSSAAPADPADPASAEPDVAVDALACGGPEATRRNPFLAFHAVIDDAEECARRNVGLDRLAEDLADAERTPALAYITTAAPVGSAGADAFLRGVVPQLLDSPAYAAGGLVVVTSDRPTAPAPPAPTSPPAATPGTTTTPPVTTTPTPPPAATTPTDPPPASTTPPPPAATPTDPPPASTTPTPPPATTTTPAPATTTATTSPATTTPTPPPPANAAPTPPAAEPVGPATYPNVGDAAAAGAGQRVGALLVSPFVKAGTVDRTPASHFTMLRTLSELFGVEPLGYAGVESVAPLPNRLFLQPTYPEQPTR